MWLIYSLLAAIAFGVRGSLYHWTSTLGFNRNLMLCGVFSSGAIINIGAAMVTGAEWNTASLIGVQMGLFSFAASASMYQGFAVAKPSLIAMLTALPPVVVVLFAFIVWNEQLHAMQWFAFIILVAGILVIRYSNDLSFKNMKGAQWGILTMIFFAANDLSTKWATMEGASMFPTLANMFVVGTLCFSTLWLIDERKKKQALQASIASHASYSTQALNQAKPKYGKRRTFSIGLAVGTTNAMGMILNVLAFGIGVTGLVSAVLAMNVIVILLYTRFVVKTPFTKLEITGMVLAIIGVLLIQLYK